MIFYTKLEFTEHRFQNVCAVYNYKKVLLLESWDSFSAQKMKFSIQNFFSKRNQIRKKLRIWSYLLKKSFMENFIFLCSVYTDFVFVDSTYIVYKTWWCSNFGWVWLKKIFSHIISSRKFYILDGMNAI